LLFVATLNASWSAPPLTPNVEPGGAVPARLVIVSTSCSSKNRNPISHISVTGRSAAVRYSGRPHGATTQLISMSFTRSLRAICWERALVRNAAAG